MKPEQLYLLITPIIPSLTGITLPQRMSMASVPASMRSSLVMTAKVLRPSGSMSLAILSDSEVAMSALAGLTARIIEFGYGSR